MIDRDNSGRLFSARFGASLDGDISPPGDSVEIVPAPPTGWKVGIHAFWQVTDVLSNWYWESNSVRSFPATGALEGATLFGTIPMEMPYSEYPWYFGEASSSVDLVELSINPTVHCGVVIYANYSPEEL